MAKRVITSRRKRTALKPALTVHPAAEFGWKVLTASTRAALSKEVASSDHLKKTKLPDTYSAASGDVRVIFKKEKGGMSTILSVLTEREISAFSLESV